MQPRQHWWMRQPGHGRTATGWVVYLFMSRVPPVPAVIELETHCSTVDLHPLLPETAPLARSPSVTWTMMGDRDRRFELQPEFFILDAATCALEYQHALIFQRHGAQGSNLWGSLFDSRSPGYR